MKKISAVIITFNEEQYIEKCLSSLIDVVDEIIVIDSYSTDNTQTICEKYNVVFIQQKFMGYIEQKNFALKKAKFDYILSLDGDEALSDQLKEEIINIKNNFKFEGYVMNRVNNYCGHWLKYSNWYPDSKLRLIKKNCGEWKGGNPHDHLELYDNNNKTILQGHILHWAYNSHEEHYLKVNYFTNIAAKNYIKYNNKKVGYLKIFINPFWKFFKNYFIKKGFLDGYSGFVVCAFASFGTFLKYMKIKEIQDKVNENRI